MRFLLFLFIGLLPLSNNPMTAIHQAFKKANHNEENAIAFNQLMQKDLAIGPHLKEAYLGASEVILADFKKGVGKKIKLFKQGRDRIEKAIAADQDNVEIRLVRLVIQNQVPRILRYHDKIKTDKKFILENYKTAPKDLKLYIEEVNKDLNLFEEGELH